MTTDHDTSASHLATKATRQRRLKVKAAYHTYQLRQNPTDRTPVGEIHLKGHWLIQAGFNIDTQVTVSVKTGQLIVTPSNDLT